MAKKKKKAAEAKEEAKPAKKDKKRSIWGIVIAIIVIVVLILLIRSCMKAAPEPAQPTGPQTPVTPAPGPLPVSEKPEEIKMCSIDNALGYVPGTCAISADSVSLTLKGQGKAGIEGIWFYMTGPDGKVSYWKDTTNGAQNAEVKFNVPAKGVVEMLALPMKDGKACFNQRIYVIREESCVR